MCFLAVDFRYNEFRDTEEDEEDVRVLFTDAIDETTDISNALAIDMTYRVLYYGQYNKVTPLGFYETSSFLLSSPKRRGTTCPMAGGLRQLLYIA